MTTLTVNFALPLWFKKPGGGARIIYEYASRLAERGHHINVVHASFLRPAQYRSTYPRRELRNLGRGVLDMLGRRPTDVSWTKLHPSVQLRYVGWISRRTMPSADVTVATSWRTAGPVARLPSECGGRVYFIQHHETWDGRRSAVDHTWRLPMRLVVISSWLADLSEELVGAPAVLVPNAIDTERFRNERPLNDRPKRVAMLWSPAPIKGGEVGLETLHLARELEPQMTAVLFGTGPGPASLPHWIEYVRNPTQDQLIQEIYNSSAVYLCPSFGEGWHLPPAEAMACGCAVVSTDIQGVRDYARHDSTALLAPVGDSRGLAESLVRVLGDRDLLERLSHAGERAISAFDWDRSVDKFEKVLSVASHDSHE